MTRLPKLSDSWVWSSKEPLPSSAFVSTGPKACFSSFVRKSALSVRVRIRGVNTVRKRLADGSRATYYYHRATGKRLAGEPNSPEFLVSFAEAERAYTQPNQDTLAGLIREFDGSAEIARKAESTQREYRRMFRAIEDEFGGVPVAVLDDPRFTGDLLAWHDQLAASTPREADNRLTVLGVVLGWAKRRQKISHNPLADGFRRAHHSERSEMVWIEQDIENFIVVASPELMLAVMIALYSRGFDRATSFVCRGRLTTGTSLPPPWQRPAGNVRVPAR